MVEKSSTSHGVSVPKIVVDLGGDPIQLQASMVRNIDVSLVHDW